MTMNSVLVVLFVSLIAVSANGHVYEDGEINCVGANDEGRMYADKTDGTKYWICPQGEDYGKKLNCPVDTVFHANEQRCIPVGAPVKCIGKANEGKKYRDLDDATRYWICVKGQDYAERKSCPVETAFMEDDQKCVPWSSWIWKAPSRD